MSFYGNTYYYTAEAFAKIILKNSNLITFNGPPTKEENPNFFPAGPIELDAVKRQCGLGLENGNYWIGLETDQSVPAIRIWHNNPCKKGTIFATRGFEKSEPPIALTPDKYTQLDFDDFIKVPVIQYDKLGHIIPPDPSEEFEDVSFFRLPLNPTEELKGRMNAIDGEDGDYENSLKAKLEKQMEDNLSEIKDIKTELDEKVSDFNEALPSIESSATKIAQAENKILILESAVSGLAASVKDLQEKIK